MASRGAWNSFNQGLQSGYTLGEKYQQAKEREELQRIMNEQPVDQQAAYDNYNAKIKAEDEATFGSSGIDDVNAGKKGLGYRVAGQTFSEKPSEGEAYAAKMNRVSDYYMGKGDLQKAMASKEYGVRSAEMAREQERRKKVDAIDKEFEGHYKKLEKDWAGVIDDLAPGYNGDLEGLDDGNIIAKASKPGGGTIYTLINKDTRQVVAAKEGSPEVARQLVDRAYLMRMKAAGGESRKWAMEQEQKDRTYGLQERGVRVQERGADTQEGLRRAQEADLAEKIRTGNWGQVGVNQAHADYYRNPPNQRTPRNVNDEKLYSSWIASREMATTPEAADAVDEKYIGMGATWLGESKAATAINALRKAAEEKRKNKEQGSGQADGNQSEPAPPSATPSSRIPGDPAYAEPSRGLGGDTYAERRDAALAEAQRQSALKASPAYMQLEAQRRAAMRAGNAVAVNAIMEKQRELLTTGQ